MERAGFVGFALVMVLFVIGFTNDLGRLMGEGFNVALTHRMSVRLASVHPAR